jgi:carbon-monoxide dehydrogenase medium subunit
MHAFEYHRPASSKDAVTLAGKKDEGKYLAGGQSLVQAMKLRLASPTDLIDLGTIKDLAGIKVSGSAVEIGAMTRHADVAGSKDVQKAIPALAALAGIIGDRQVRNMGTTAARSPTTIRRPTIPPRCSAWVRPSPPTSARSKPTSSSRASTKRHSRRAS